MKLIKTLGLLSLGAALGLALSPLAANKVATFVPPADNTSQGWTICIAPTETAGTYTISTNACASDAGTGLSDCRAHTAKSSAAAFDTFVNNRLAAWRTAFGY